MLNESNQAMERTATRRTFTFAGLKGVHVAPRSLWVAVAHLILVRC